VTEALEPLRTWSHLATTGRRPTEYEVVSVGLHYHTRHPDCPWELDPDLFMNEWYRRHREGSALHHPDWNSFRDPDSLIYRGYIRLQNDQETYTEGLVDQYSSRRHDATLSPLWLTALGRFYTPARYARHALQLAAAYGGQMAPASTLTNCFFFQCADEARLMQRIAYRTAELRQNCRGYGFGADERRTWEEDPAWQGFRELLERLLVAWDWGECFVALNLVAKPALDEVTLRQLATAAGRAGDELLALLCEAHRADVQRSRRWSAALVKMLTRDPHNRIVVRGWLERWLPFAERAARAYLATLPGIDGEAAAHETRAACREYRGGMGLA
jgi:toluene monooxygenase system protein E